MKIITSVIIIIVILVFFSVPGTLGEKIEKELLYGFRILAGFFLLAGSLRVIIIQIERRKAEKYQKITSYSLLFVTPLILLFLIVTSVKNISLLNFFINAIAVPLWSSFAALTGLSLSLAVMRSIKLKKWETFYLAVISSIFLLAFSLPLSFTQINLFGKKTITILNSTRYLFSTVYIGAERGFLIGFFVLVLIMRLRILLGREKRSNEFFT